MLRNALIAVLLRLTPGRWRESVAGDFEESGRGGLFTLLSGVRVVARLWLEELSIGRAKSRRRITMNATGLHLRQAIRSLARRPAYSLVVIATLAVGIGANASVFGLANWLMFRPVPAVQNLSALATIRLEFPDGGVFFLSHPEMEAVQAHVPSIIAIAGSVEASFNAAPQGGEAERVQGGIVSANYFEVLGVRPFAGRAFSAADPGVVISHAYWQRRWNSEVDAIGKTMLINGKPQPVLGIAPRGFAGTSRSSSVDVWAPSTLRTTMFPGSRTDPLVSMRAGIYMELVARLAPGTRAEEARARLESLPAILAKVHPNPRKYRVTRFSADEGLTSRGYERERLAKIFSLLMVLVGMLLVLASANVGSVMLAAGSVRGSEFATRQALGASRRQIVSAVLLESVLLSLAGGAVAIALASAMSALMRGTIVLPFMPALGDISLDARVFAFALAASTAAAIGAGLLPALSATRVDLISSLKSAGRSGTRGGHRIRKGLTIAQVAVSLTLLIGALLLARSIHERRQVDTGFDAGRVLTFSIEPGLHWTDEGKLRSFYADLMTRVSAVPGVSGAALSWDRPFGTMANDSDVRAADGLTQDAIAADIFMVGPNYFETMGIPLVGREFTPRDQLEDNMVRTRPVILSSQLARRLFGSPDAALGRSIEYFDQPHDVVGVATDARLRRAFEAPSNAVYSPIGLSQSFASIHVRAAVPAQVLAPALREALRQADASIPLYDMMTALEALDRQMAEEILVGRLAIGFAIIATLLAAVGLYGVLAQAVADRRVEIGIRTALGAAPARVLRLVTSEAFRMTAIGAAAGIALAAWLSGYLESRLFGVERFDVLTFAAALGIITAVSMAASIVPAMRAARVDPVMALRQ